MERPMTISMTGDSAFEPWSEEPTTRPDRRKIRTRIGGLHCSLCTGTIEKALGRLPGVDKVAVSLTHEQALVEYDPAVARPGQLLQTLRDIGYTISDPRKLRAFEEEERDLVREARRFVAAVALSVAAIPIIADPAVGWIGFLPALVCLSLGGFVFLVLRSSGFWIALGAAGGLGLMALTLLYLNLQGYLTNAAPWLVGALAVILVFGVGRHIPIWLFRPYAAASSISMCFWKSVPSPGWPEASSDLSSIGGAIRPRRFSPYRSWSAPTTFSRSGSR